MKALILVGGFGTRLRPLTLTLPKPLIEFANKPMILHQIEALAAVGVYDIVLAVNYRSEIMVNKLKQYEEKYGVKITFSVETEPLGTAGPIALAREVLGKDNTPFLVLNSDIVCDYPFEELLEFHSSHKGMGTIVVTKVEEPSKYGVVVCRPNSSEIESFVEKPTEFVSNRINAGIYVFDPEILDIIEPKPTSIEKEIFPKLAKERNLFTFDLEGFWMDVGQPKDYLTGLCLYLKSLSKKDPKALKWHEESIGPGTEIIAPDLIHPTAKIGKNCRIGPNVSIGANVIIEDGVRLQRCSILDGSVIKSYACVTSSIIGWNSKVGSWSRLENVSVLGDDVCVQDEVYVNGGFILPHKSISSNIETPQIVM